MYDRGIQNYTVDFLVVGSGAAGLFSALKLSELGEVLIITKSAVENSCTEFAQGGIAAAVSDSDSPSKHYRDTLKAGDGMCSEKAVEILVSEGPERIKELIDIGADFDRYGDGYDLTKEGGHSGRRILHSGDTTGKEVRETLLNKVKREDNITVRENIFMLELLSAENSGEITGVLVLDYKNENLIRYFSSFVVLATGGCGRLYSGTTNPPGICGDGIAAAFRAGAKVSDMEFIQFHPTVFCAGDEPFLISESLRGEGAVLRNEAGKRFMLDYHDMGELAPRDIVTRAIFREMMKTSTSNVWLDATDMEKSYLSKRFPGIYKKLKEEGIEISNEMIPVIPGAHYLMGGIVTDLYGRTSLKNLFACGETACTGVHGANRLASNSLLETLVFAHRIYRAIRRESRAARINNDDSDIVQKVSESSCFLYDEDMLFTGKDDMTFSEPEDIKDELRNKMNKKAGIIRNRKQLSELNDWLRDKRKYIEKQDIDIYDYRVWELRNMLYVGEIISSAALARRESRGGHFRSDYEEGKQFWSGIHIVFEGKGALN